jgi:hypothetical protein
MARPRRPAGGSRNRRAAVIAAPIVAPVRRIRVLPVALLALVAVGAAVVLASSAASVRRGGVVIKHAGSFYGIGLSSAPSDKDYARMARAGVRIVRFTADWRTIQPTPGSYNWAGIDAEVGGAARHGISAFGTLFATPPWVAKSFIKAPIFSAPARAAWRSFLGAAVARYGPHGSFWAANPSIPYHPVRDWQIWNEENSPDFFGPKPSPGAYLKLLKLSGAAIHAGDPKARIILGGMFEGNVRHGAILSWKYVAKLYGLGGGKHFDAVGAHPYSPRFSGYQFQLDKLHKAIKGRDPIWIDEIGWGSGPHHASPLNKGPKGQAEFLRRSFKYATKNRRKLDIKRIVWFPWRDSGHTPPNCAFCAKSGLIAASGKAKPSWHAFESFSKH